MTTGHAGHPATRVATDIPALLEHVADAFELGGVRDWSVLTTGYEDCNIDLTTTAGRVVVKIFAAARATGIAARTAEIITRVRAAGVRHPRLHHDVLGDLVHDHAGHQVLVMDFVPGRTLYDLDRAPTPAELAEVIVQAARIHTIDGTPKVVFDPWAITNLVPMAEQVQHVLDTEQQHLIAQAVDGLSGVDRAALPTAVIHADLTKGNVLLADTGEVVVLDFAVTNRLPRIQELAVIAANLCHRSPGPLPYRAAAIADLYSATAADPLTAAERAALQAFTRAAAAMELLGALAEWHQRANRSAETAYLIDLGLAGLRDAANHR